MENPALLAAVLEAPNAMSGIDTQTRDLIISAVIERQQRRQRGELGIRGPPLARLIGDVGEAQAVLRPPPEMRHHLLAVDPEVDGEVLQRLHLHDNQVGSARGGELAVMLFSLLATLKLWGTKVTAVARTCSTLRPRTLE